MYPKTLLSNTRAGDAVNLERFVLDGNSLEQDYFDPKFPIQPDTIIIRQQLNFPEILQRTSGSKLHSFLTAIVAGVYSKRDEKQIKINSLRNTTYQLIRCL